jgi:hypothetical protein
METDIFEKYRKLQEKFNLPQLNELKETFRFEIEKEDEMFDQIRVEMSDRLFTFTEKLIEPIIGGSDSFCCMFEQNMVTDRERNELFMIYKKIQVLKWENNLLTMKPDEERTVEWIMKAWSFWNNELECTLTKLCQKLSSSWGNLKLKNEKTSYHG